MELPRVLKSGRRRVLVHKAQPLSPFAKDRLLADFLDTELLDWEFAANQLAVENEYRESADPRLRADHAVSMLLDLMDRAPQADSTALARRFVGYLCGPRLPPVEYVVIDLAPERSVIELFDGWQVSACNEASVPYDPLLPIFERKGLGLLRDPGDLTSTFSFGAVRHEVRHGAPSAASPQKAHVLTWPTLMLNLHLMQPVKPIDVFWTEPGREQVMHDESASQSHGAWAYAPPELQRWIHNPASMKLSPPQTLDENACVRLERFARSFGGRLARLTPKLAEQYSRAADHYLFVRFHTPSRPTGQETALPDLHPSEAAFRWTVALESLLVSQSGPDLSRRVSQRAAALSGRSDDERLQIERTVKAAYAARSAYAHGGSARSTDLAAIHVVIRRVMLDWLAVVAAHGSSPDRLLDEALLSHRVLTDDVQSHVIAFEAD